VEDADLSAVHCRNGQCVEDAAFAHRECVAQHTEGAKDTECPDNLEHTECLDNKVVSAVGAHLRKGLRMPIVDVLMETAALLSE